MRSDVAHLLALFDQNATAGVASEDFAGPLGDTLRAWQDDGIVGREPGMNPAASCPHCGDGAPYRLGERYLCHTCQSRIDPRHLFLWPLNLPALLRRIAGHFRLRSDVRAVDESLWQLGTGEADGEPVECFYRRNGPHTAAGVARLGAYRRLIVLHGPNELAPAGAMGQWVPLLEAFDADGSLRAVDLTALLGPRGVVRFELHSGALWAGTSLLGEVPVGSREYFLLVCLAERPDHFVPYGDLKREILRRAGGIDGTDEATFCHGLKRRIKKHGIAAIDRLIVTTNKADGYRLRGYMTAS